MAGTSSYPRLLLFKSRMVAVTSASVIFEINILFRLLLTNWRGLFEDLHLLVSLEPKLTKKLLNSLHMISLSSLHFSVINLYTQLSLFSVYTIFRTNDFFGNFPTDCRIIFIISS